jgi:hypothetical protein
MRMARVLTIALLMIAAATLSVGADPITNPSAVDEQTGGFDAALFDGGGSAFLLTADPSYFQILRRGGSNPNDGDNGGNGGGGSGSNPFVQDFSFFSGSPGGGNGDGGIEFSGNFVNSLNSGDSENSGSGGDAMAGLAGGSLGDIPGDSFIPQGSGDLRVPIITAPDLTVPEPSMLLLLAPAAAFLLRRRVRS